MTGAIAVRHIDLVGRMSSMFQFLGRILGNSAGSGRNARGRGARGPGRTARELEARRQQRFLGDLEHRDPRLYHEMMLKRVGLGQDDGRIDMGQVMKVIEYLKQIGLKVVPSKGGTDLDDDSLRSWIKDLAPMFAPVLAQAMGGRAQPPTNPEPAADYRVLPPDQPALPPGHMTLVSKFLINQLDGKSAADAAAWLLAQPQAAPLTGRLKDTPDVQILALLDELASQAPDYAGFVAWLKAHPDWTIQTVHEIRAQSGGSATSTPASPPPGAMGI